MSSRKGVIHGQLATLLKTLFSSTEVDVHTPAANRYSLISYDHCGPSGSFATGRHSMDSMKWSFAVAARRLTAGLGAVRDLVAMILMCSGGFEPQVSPLSAVLGHR
jgi:hypothetical protein